MGKAIHNILLKGTHIKARRDLILGLVFAVFVLCLILGFAWVGTIGSDDLEYYEAGRRLSASFWQAPGDFGGMRTAITIPIAISFKIFGDHEWSLILPTVLYSLGGAVITLFALTRLIPLRHAVIATVLFMSMPVVAITSTFASADLAEWFWAVCAFWLAILATQRTGFRQSQLMVLTGACIALAFAGRETAAAMSLWLGAGFVAGYAMPRAKYLWSGVGFFAVVGLECIYFAITFGNPLARLDALLGTRSHTTRVSVPPFTFDDTGNLRIFEPIDPIVMMLTKHSFGVLFWVLAMVAVVAWLTRARASAANKHTVPIAHSAAKTSIPIVPALALGLIWAVFAAIVLAKIRIHPRYYLASAYFLAVAAFLWYHSRAPGTFSAKRGTLIVVVMAFANFAGIWVENRNPRFSERALASMALTSLEPIHTDPATAYIASVFYRWSGGKVEKILKTPAQSGQLQFRILTGVTQDNRIKFESATDSKPVVVVERRATPPLIAGPVGAAISEMSFIPLTIRNKLTGSRSEAQLVRAGGES